VVAYGSRDHLPACLDAIAGVAGIEDVVVVDHGGDGSADLALALGAIALKDPSNPGYGTGQNRGVARTSSKYVLLANPDAVIHASGISVGLRLLEAAQDVAAVQGVIRNVATGQPERSQGVALGPVHLIARALGLRRLLRFGIVRRVFRRAPIVADHVVRTPDEPTDVESLGATALLMRRVAFDAVGGFDEGFFLYGEDLDLCRRLRDAGWRLVALPVHWADHAQGASSSGWWVRELVWWEGTLRYAARWWSAPAWVGARVATGLRILPMIAAQPRRTPEVLARLVATPGRVRRSHARRA
jgi:GT2 family glycosyltransferase